MSTEETKSPENAEISAPIVTQVESVQEEFASNALIASVPGIVIAALGGIVLFYQVRQGGVLAPFGVVLIVIGFGLIGWGVYQASKVKKVESFAVACPFCEARNLLTASPTSDFRCTKCNREVPVAPDGSILDVFQVRCGYCNTLNYYSEKSTGLICEECDREIPIASDEETHAKKLFDSYTVHDDNHPYDLILNEAPQSEEMIKCLQSMLALNRNQVKDILNDLPQTLLQGIPKKKAELLTAQITVHKGKATSQLSEY